MPVNEHLIDIPGRIRSAAIEKHVCGTDQVYDDDWEKTQYQINRLLKGYIDTLGEGVTQINNSINNINQTLNNQGDSISSILRAINSLNNSINALNQGLESTGRNITNLTNRVTELEGLWQKKTISGQQYVSTDYKVLGAGMYDSTV